MIFMMVGLTLSQEKLKPIIDEIRGVLERTKVEKGCASCRLFQGVDDKDKTELFIIELWNSESELRKHILSDNYRKLLVFMEHSVEPPELKFCHGSEMAGYEYIKNIINSSDQAAG